MDLTFGTRTVMNGTPLFPEPLINNPLSIVKEISNDKLTRSLRLFVHS